MGVALGSGVAASAAAAQPSLADLSLEELANLEVTSVSRRAERLSNAAASVFVITEEDIRRSGATSLPEVLRLAPNLQVARIDARQYAITARGFNGTAASNKLLVLMDGRVLYTPLFSGVFWDAQDTFLQDIERIEVISGPGGTLWGTNAVNGVINVITRRASDTIGTIAIAGAGNSERGVAARHGTRLAGDGAFRVYGKYFDRDNTVRGSGDAASDEWHNGQAGFRADWGTAASGTTLQVDAYRARIDQAAPGDVDVSGGNLLARWHRETAQGGRWQFQAYLDNTERDIPGTFAERLDTLDVELQHGFELATAHFLTWGLGNRRSRDHVTNSAVLAFLPADRSLRWTSLFAQDEIKLRERLHLTVGARLERNPFTGEEFLPSVRLAWKPRLANLAWAAVSRAVRAPSRIDREFFAPGQPPFTTIAGGADFRSEVSDVFEVGYRDQPSLRISYSATLFYSRHDHLRTLQAGPGGAFVIGNEMEGSTTGIEAWGSFQATPGWRLSAGATVLDQDLRLKSASADPSSIAVAGNDPDYQLSLRSIHDLGSRRQLDVRLRHVAALPDPEVPHYTALDLRYAWQLGRALELSVTGSNLLDKRHAEFGAPASRSEIERSIFLAVKWSR
jgi:iron complex outermembrane receptor protein